MRYIFYLNDKTIIVVLEDNLVIENSLIIVLLYLNIMNITFEVIS